MGSENRQHLLIAKGFTRSGDKVIGTRALWHIYSSMGGAVYIVNKSFGMTG